MGRRGGQRPNGHSGARFVRDPLTDNMAELRPVQPYQALKDYLCPACNQQIATGLGHLVVVPLGDPAERRHWHHGCWLRRTERRAR